MTLNGRESISECFDTKVLVLQGLFQLTLRQNEFLRLSVGRTPKNKINIVLSHRDMQNLCT